MTATNHNRVVMWCAVLALFFTACSAGMNALHEVSGGFIRNDSVELNKLTDQMHTLKQSLDAATARLDKLPDQRDMAIINKAIGSQQAQIDGIDGRLRAVESLANVTSTRVDDLKRASEIGVRSTLH